jgi:hypothetical protein
MDRYRISASDITAANSQSVQINKNGKLKGILISALVASSAAAIGILGNISITKLGMATVLAAGTEQITRDIANILLGIQGSDGTNTFGTQEIFIPCDDSLAFGDYIYVHTAVNAATTHVKYQILLVVS